MSKKKKKTKKLTASQTVRLRVSGAAGTVRSALKEAGPKVSRCWEAFAARADAFVRCRYSAALISVLMLGLMLFSYSLTRYNYLFHNFPMYATRMIQFYLIDYHAGFVSRALVGHVISLFTDRVTLGFIVRLTHAVLQLSLVPQAVLAALAFKKAWLNKSPLIAWMFVLFAISYHTVIPNIINFGILDTYNLILVILYIYVSDTKAAPVLAPVICFTGIILHYQFALAYLTLVLSVELYHAVKYKEGRRLRVASLCITALGSAALTVYLVFFSKYNMKMDAEALYQYMCSKYADLRSTGLFEEYFTFYIYGDYQGVNYSNPADFVKFLIGYAQERINPLSHLCYALSTFPVFGIMLYFWAELFRRAEKKKRLPYLVFMLQPLTLVAGMIVSTDTSRWAGAAWFSNYMLLFTALKNDGPLLAQAAAKAVDRRWKKAVAAAVLIAAYLVSLYIYISE